MNKLSTNPTVWIRGQAPRHKMTDAMIGAAPFVLMAGPVLGVRLAVSIKAARPRIVDRPNGEAIPPRPGA